MPHPDYDLNHWRELLLTNSQGEIDESDARGMGGLFTDSPKALIGIEYFRSLARGKGLDLGPRVPVDEFVFGRGEPPERHLSKVHGLPYRPRNIKWPIDEFGKPLTFLAQFSFVDSCDHIGTLPGDVLLIFIKNMYDHGCIRLEFEWYSLGIDDLVMSAPSPDLKFPICYAVRHRSWDFSDEAIATKAMKSLLDVEDIERFSRDKQWLESILRALTCYRGMKIGGVPSWNKPSEIPEEVQTAGKFICAFDGVNVIHDSPYPFVNEKKSLSSEESRRPENNLTFFSGLIFNFYLKGDGSVDYFGQLG